MILQALAAQPTDLGSMPSRSQMCVTLMPSRVVHDIQRWKNLCAAPGGKVEIWNMETSNISHLENISKTYFEGRNRLEICRKNAIFKDLKCTKKNLFGEAIVNVKPFHSRKAILGRCAQHGKLSCDFSSACLAHQFCMFKIRPRQPQPTKNNQKHIPKTTFNIIIGASH